uniref:Uncharacterized protein n=1 Tax=Romanomermis culicivorax TaxID=13658 RepID=A0A915JX13_ROMCU
MIKTIFELAKQNFSNNYGNNLSKRKHSPTPCILVHDLITSNNCVNVCVSDLAKCCSTTCVDVCSQQGVVGACNSVCSSTCAASLNTICQNICAKVSVGIGFTAIHNCVFRILGDVWDNFHEHFLQLRVGKLFVVYEIHANQFLFYYHFIRADTILCCENLNYYDDGPPKISNDW